MRRIKFKEETIVALVVSGGMTDFLRNALVGLARVGIDPRLIKVARPDNSATEVDPILNKAAVQIHSFKLFEPAFVSVTSDSYANYGSKPFIELNWAKVRYLSWLLDRYDHVVYADVDIGWIANPMSYLRMVSERYPLAFQTEAVAQFPPAFCWGFLSAKRTFATRRFFRNLIRAHDALPPDAPAINQQAWCNAWIAKHSRWRHKIYPLPEGLFLNGLGYRNLSGAATPDVAIEGEITPFIFHSNWTIGLESKRALMRHTGTWLVD